ncbi:MAG TPA: hypothetical protein ENI79_00820 [Rhodospirillales bacterium]|nr:hypothetical protein [Rhodospirillales bacterium]
MVNWGVFAGALALAFLPLRLEPAAAAKSAPSFFNTMETKSSRLKVFKKWNTAVARYSKETAEKKKGNCKATTFNKCHYERWMKFLKTLKGKDPMTQLRRVNLVMNRSKYILDITNWGVKDYWESPGEFLTRSGDCEDYAIIKYMSLKILGFKVDNMRVAVLNDLNLKIGHAILMVYLDGKILVLDNQIKKVVEAKTIRHYQPVYSINEKNWWRHRAK